MHPLVVVFLLVPTLAFGADLKTSVAAFVETVLTKKDPGAAFNPKNWSDRLELQALDVNNLLHTDLPDGIAYGAVATKEIDFPYKRVKQFLLSEGGSYRLVTSVKTMRNFEKISEIDGETRVKMNIKVPVVADIKTEVVSRVHQDAQGHGIIEWKQAGDYGDLVYNQGAVLVESAGEKTRVLVIGIHVIKPERRVPWFGRGTAKSFAKTHYGNFVEALETVLNAEQRAEKI